MCNNDVIIFIKQYKGYSVITYFDGHQCTTNDCVQNCTIDSFPGYGKPIYYKNTILFPMGNKKTRPLIFLNLEILYIANKFYNDFLIKNNLFFSARRKYYKYYVFPNNYNLNSLEPLK